MITKEQAMTANNFTHVSIKDSRGNPAKVRRNGNTKTWKTRPNEFKVPVKYGLYEYLYITQDNAHEYNVIE